VKENLSLQTFTILRLFNLQLAINTVYIFLQSPSCDRCLLDYFFGTLLPGTVLITAKKITPANC
ncbi:MAG: hypothetical protein ABRQ38_05750, partial [Candidatus Eremiobacterota bacterium]